MRTLEVLGPVRVDGERLTSPTQLVLVSVLAATAPEAVPFHRLVDAVWEDPPRSAENSLHSHLSRLRRILGPGSILREGAAYRLASPTDATRFLATVDGATRAGPDDRRRELERALSLWRGVPYGDRTDHRFLRSSAAALTTARSRAVREIAGLDISEGNAAAAVEALQALAASQPLDEDGWALLVEALDASGRRAEALRAVQEATRHLAEVGLEPSRRLRDVEAMVLLSPTPGPGSEIPLPAGPLVGRNRLLDELVEVVRGAGWTTLTGPGGVGKTRLAIEVVGRVEGPVVFSDLTEVEADDVEITLARAAGVPLRPPYLDRIATRLRGRGAVLVLDCCEVAAPTVAALGSRLRRSCTDLHVLATSRLRVGAAGERLIEIEPLEGADAVELLRTRLVDGGMLPPEPQALDALCRAVDRLPLTIEMLAGAMRSLSPDELLHALDDPLRALGGPGGDLASSVARSVALLGASERETFELLSLFRGPFVLDTAARVACCERDDVEFVNRLRSLRERSLVVTVDTEAGRRLRILDTVRAVGRAHLEEREAIEKGESQFVATFCERAEEIDAGLRSVDEVRWAAIADAEVVDLRAAHRIASARGDAGASMRVAASMFHLAYDRIRPELATWGNEAIAEFGDEHPLAPRVLAVAALGAMHTDHHARAWSLVERARADARSPERHVELIAANLALRSADLAAATVAARRTAEASEAAGDAYTAGVAHVLHALAVGYGGDVDGALAIAAEARRRSREVGAPTLLAYADYVEGELLSESDPDIALELLHRAYDRAVASDSALAVGISLVTITSLRARSADPTGADEAFATALKHWRDRGDWNRQWVTLRNLAEYLARTDRQDAAAEIVGAIDAHGPAAFGTEAERLDAARDRLRRGLGSSTFERLRARGRSVTRRELLDLALAITAQGPRPVRT